MPVRIRGLRCLSAGHWRKGLTRSMGALELVDTLPDRGGDLGVLHHFEVPGRGSDVMVPMALPTFGGMLLTTITVFVVPVIYCWEKEIQFGRRSNKATP